MKRYGSDKRKWRAFCNFWPWWDQTVSGKWSYKTLVGVDNTPGQHVAISEDN